MVKLLGLVKSFPDHFVQACQTSSKDVNQEELLALEYAYCRKVWNKYEKSANKTSSAWFKGSIATA